MNEYITPLSKMNVVAKSKLLVCSRPKEHHDDVEVAANNIIGYP